MRRAEPRNAAAGAVPARAVPARAAEGAVPARATAGTVPPAVGARRVHPLVASGFAEVALGALAGWPYALVKADPERARRIGIKAPARLRQWHLDLVMLGGLSALAGTALPDLPRRVAWPLGVGAWTNAMAFLPLVVAPEVERHPAYRAAVGASFVTTSAGFAGLAATALRRRRR